MKTVWRFILCSVVLLGIPLWSGETLVRTVGNRPALIHPQYEVGSFWQNVLRDMYEPLMTFDKEGKIIPGQARAYTVEENGTRYLFTLRDDLRWSDGTPVTAEDFVYSFRHTLTPSDKHFDWFIAQLPIRNLSAIRTGKAPVTSLGIHALGPRKVEIVLDHPFPYLLNALTHLSLVPLPHHLADRPWPAPEKIVGNGPYRIRRVTSQTLELEKNPYYYAPKGIRLDRVVYWVSDEETQTYRKYRNNEIDYLNEIPKNLYKQIRRERPAEVHTFPIFGTCYLSLDMRMSPTNRLEVRKALGYAINREKLAYEVMGSGERPIYTFVPRGMHGYRAWRPEYQTWSQERREEVARTLLLVAGYTPEHPLTFTLLTNRNEQNRRAMLAVISMWKEVFGQSIHVRLEILPWDRYYARKQSIPVVRSGWVADYDNPVSMLIVLSRDHMFNISAYDNPRYDALLQQANRTDDPRLRSQMFQELEQMILREWPIIPLFQYATARLIKPWVHGYPAQSPLDIIQSRYLYKDPPR